MQRFLFLFCFLALLACDEGASNDTPGQVDAAAVTDARSDDGGVLVDATGADGAVALDDGGSARADGGGVPADAATPVEDGGAPAGDVGPPAIDAGAIVPDAAVVDAAPPAMAPAIIEDAGDELVLLFVGNSYINSNNLQNIVCELARQTERWETVRCERVTAGGKRLTQHEADAAAGRRLGEWLDPENAERPQWDAVILQEQSQIPGFPQGQADLLAHRQAVLDLNARIAAVGAETALMMTWGRRDGDNRNEQLYPDFLTMQNRLAAGYEASAQAASTPERAVHVIPVGRAWQQTFERDAEGDFLALYSRDGSHPAFLGSWLSAAVILNHLVALSPDDAGPTDRGPEMEQLLRLREDVRAVSP